MDFMEIIQYLKNHPTETVLTTTFIVLSIISTVMKYTKKIKKKDLTKHNIFVFIQLRKLFNDGLKEGQISKEGKRINSIILCLVEELSLELIDSLSKKYRREDFLEIVRNLSIRMREQFELRCLKYNISSTTISEFQSISSKYRELILDEAERLAMSDIYNSNYDRAVILFDFMTVIIDRLINNYCEFSKNEIVMEKSDD